MTFHDVRFPASLSFGSVGGPERRVEIVTLANGYEERNAPWAHARRRYDAGFGLRSLDDLGALIAFFEARSGQLTGFRWKDWTDYKSSLASREPASDDQFIGRGDEVQTIFQLTKSYRSGEAEYLRPITKPVAGTVKIEIETVLLTEGVDWALDAATGLITFAAPPGPNAEIKAGYEFDVPVRFDTDAVLASVASFRAGEMPSVPVIEVRV